MMHMQGLPEFISSSIQAVFIYIFIQQPLVAVTIVALSIGIGIVYIFVMAPVRAENRVAELVHRLDAVTAKLNEAQKLGNFGSFSWDFNNPMDSFWSEQM